MKAHTIIPFATQILLNISSVSAQNTKQPNILFIMTDQQSYDALSCMGNEYIKTPNIDRIAKDGYRFEKTYCSNPVSMPSRFSLMTGRFSSEVGFKGNRFPYDKDKLSRITPESLGNLFKNAGYETTYIGKTHFPSNSKNKEDYGFNILTENPYEAGAEAAENFFTSIPKRDREKPFFLVVSLLNPHDICYQAGMDPRYPNGLSPEYVEATKKYLDYKNSLSEEEYRKQVPPPLKNESLMESDSNDPDMVSPDWVKSDGKMFRKYSEEQKGLYRWMYCRLNESVDELIGKTLDAFEQAGYADNTIVVFTSDHGELLGAHGFATKNAMFEECQRVPFIFKGAGIKKAVDKNTLVCNGTDLLPTLCDLAGISIPKGLPGISLKSHLIGKREKIKRDYIVTENYNGYQIHDGRHKYSVYEYPGNPAMFTDIEADPYERINSLKDPAYQNIIMDLKTKLYDCLDSRQLLPLGEKDMKEKPDYIPKKK